MMWHHIQFNMPPKIERKGLSQGQMQQNLNQLSCPHTPLTFNQKKEYIYLSLQEQDHLVMLNHQVKEEKPQQPLDDHFEVLGTHEEIHNIKEENQGEAHYPIVPALGSQTAQKETIPEEQLMKKEEIVLPSIEGQDEGLPHLPSQQVEPVPSVEKGGDYSLLNQQPCSEPFSPQLQDQTEFIELHNLPESPQTQENTIQQARQTTEQAPNHPLPQENQDLLQAGTNSYGRIIDITSLVTSQIEEEEEEVVAFPPKSAKTEFEQVEHISPSPQKTDKKEPQQGHEGQNSKVEPQLSAETKPCQEGNLRKVAERIEVSKDRQCQKGMCLKGTSGYILAVLAVWVLWVAY